MNKTCELCGDEHDLTEESALRLCETCAYHPDMRTAYVEGRWVFWMEPELPLTSPNAPDRVEP